MKFVNRAIVIVLDSVGVGELPDAADYGDSGSNTLAHVAEVVGGLYLPNLAEMGIGNIASIHGVGPVALASACYGKMAERSAGKDTTTGHWELMGIITEKPFPTYPHGFPPEIISEFEKRTGRKVLGNKVASGTEIIQELGEEHIRSGRPIVYTSADSVFQIACHEDVIPVEELYKMCRIARSILTAPHNVQRVIARPFTGTPGKFVRTERRRDFALEPQGETLMDLIVSRGGEVIGIGKIEDIFAGRGVTKAVHASGNSECIKATLSSILKGEGTLVFTNLVDFDMLYGHRNDPVGYARAMENFDAAVPHLMEFLRDEDVMVITADHGCDPTTSSTDHSREYVPLLVYGRSLAHGINLGIRETFSDVACTLADLLDIPHQFPGVSFADRL